MTDKKKKLGLVDDSLFRYGLERGYNQALEDILNSLPEGKRPTKLGIKRGLSEAYETGFNLCLQLVHERIEKFLKK